MLTKSRPLRRWAGNFARLCFKILVSGRRVQLANTRRPLRKLSVATAGYFARESVVEFAVGQ